MYLATYVTNLASQNTFNKINDHNKNVSSTLERGTTGGGLEISLKEKSELDGIAFNDYVVIYVNFSFPLDHVRDQIDLTSFKKSAEFIIKECKETSKDNNEIEIKSITEEGGAAIISESNDGAVTVNE